MNKYLIFIYFAIFSIVLAKCSKENVDLYNEVINENRLELLDSKLGAKQLDKYNRKQLRILRNFYFARKGYIFKSDDLKNFFKKYSWYTPQKQNVSNLLSQLDIDNIKTIQDSENKLVKIYYLESNYGTYINPFVEKFTFYLDTKEAVYKFPNYPEIYHEKIEIKVRLFENKRIYYFIKSDNGTSFFIRVKKDHIEVLNKFEYLENDKEVVMATFKERKI